MSVYCSASTGRTTRSSEGLSPKMFVKGAPEGILDRCSKVRVGKDTVELTAQMKDRIIEQVTAYGTGNFLFLFFFFFLLTLVLKLTGCILSFTLVGL